MGDELKTDGELDWLDARLRDEQPYIDDAGFTARVVHQLPVRRRAPRFLRGAILLAATLIASLVAFFFAGSTVLESAAFLAAMPMRLLFIFGVLASVLTMIAGGTFALSRSRDPRL